MPRLRSAALAGALLLPVLLGGSILLERAHRDSAQVFDQVLNLVQDRYVDSVPADALYEKAARGLVSQLKDPYSELFSPKQLKRFATQSTGRYGGIGMQIEQQEGNIVVVRVFPHTPAEGAGIIEGDRIVAIDSASTRGWTSQQVSDVLIGNVGTKVRVRFARPGIAASIEHGFVRAEIHIPAVPYAVMLDHEVGYVALQTFNETAAEELRAATDRLVRDGAKSVIIDLRGDPGGILDQALNVASLYLKQGQSIASVRTRQGAPQQYNARGDEHLTAIPLVALVDGYSASASEIVAGALQDHDRALLVGTRTYGKGLVQTVYNLQDGWALKLTTGKWYTPSARSIQREHPRPGPDDAFDDGAPADTASKDTSLSSRPTVRSEGGRLLYGGGGITPDVVVLPDTLTLAEQALNALVAAKFTIIRAVLYDFALQQKESVKPGFAVTADWRDTFYRRLEQDSVRIDRKTFDAASTLVDRWIGLQVARVAFGDSGAFRRSVSTDPQLQRAVALLAKSRSQQDLFTLADAKGSAPTKNR
jgi:carboxyl-terminal processing protease